MLEYSIKILKELAGNSALSQRELSKRLGISLGKVNYLINALIDKGLLKAERFRNSKNKIAYMYTLTPDGIKSRVELTSRFLRKKIQEYDEIEKEITDLQEELRNGVIDSVVEPPAIDVLSSQDEDAL